MKYKSIPIVWDEDEEEEKPSWYVPGKQNDAELRILATLMGATNDEQVKAFIAAWRRKFGG